MTHKPLILGVVTALTMAGGAANAADCVSGSIATITGAGFTCTLGDTIFSNFTTNLNANQATNNDVLFDVTNGGLVETINFQRRGNQTLGTSTRNFFFTITVNPADSGITISSDNVHVVGVTAMGGTQLNTTATTTGNISGTQTAGPTSNPFLHTFILTGDTSTQVALMAGSGSANHLGSAQNTFTLAEAEVPEPASLALFGLGLAGLGLTARRKRN